MPTTVPHAPRGLTLSLKLPRRSMLSALRARLAPVAFVSITLALTFAAACGDTDGEADSPCGDLAVNRPAWCDACEDSFTRLACDPLYDTENTCVCNYGNSGTATPTPTGTTSPQPQPQPQPQAGWRFVMLEDLLSPVAGEFPGIDVDAIELVDVDGTSYFAVTVEDFQLGGGSALDTSQILGAPDSNCDPNSGAFVALGGADAGGYIIVGFSSAAQDVTFGAGSTITVHELGASMCGQFDDDPYAVAVSVSTDRSTFTQIGTATGMTAIPVTTNP